MIRIVKPFIELLRRRNFALSRWSIFKTLVLLAILKRTQPGKESINVRLGKFIVYGPDYDVLSFLIKEKFINEEYYFSTSNPSPVIIDCGASIGLSVIYFKCLYPNATIYCFEPYSAAFQYLQKNVAENELEKVILYNKALYDVDGLVTLYIPPYRSSINSSVVSGQLLGRSEQVQSMKLSRFLKEFQNVGLVKIDVEGAEWEIAHDLEQGSALSNGNVEQFIIEYHYSSSRTDKDLELFVKFFESNCYRIKRQVLFPENPKSDLLFTAQRLYPCP